MKVFISYSHNDSKTLDRLHTHLAVLRRDGRIAEWFDREILAGSEIDSEIEERLESSSLFLLLISPDFLASDYCIDREMARALQRHHAGKARVIPIIVEPCEWKHTSLGNLKALPRDGEPISNWTNENDALHDVVQELRRVLDAEEELNTDNQNERKNQKISDSSHQVHRYRIKRDFDKIDRSDFRENAFRTIRDYFEAEIREIDAVEGLKARFSSRSGSSFSCSIVNKMRKHGTAHITVHDGSDSAWFGAISFSFDENAPSNSANGLFSIEADEYELHLSSTLGFETSRENMSPDIAAKRLWERFLANAGITGN